MAYMLAQQRLQRARLSRDDDGNPDGRYTLATSAQPCCQCYGATIWAGIDRLLIGARAQDVMELTEFDEGPLPADWVGELDKRGIEVVRDVNRDDARAVLRAYGAGGGQRYGTAAAPCGSGLRPPHKNRPAHDHRQPDG